MSNDEIINKIADEFSDRCNRNNTITSLLHKLDSGEADYLDADQYALEFAKELGAVIGENLGEDKITPEAYKEIIKQVIPEGLADIYDDVSYYAEGVQKAFNERMNLGINTVKPDFNNAEANTIAQKAAESDNYSETAGETNQQLLHAAQNVATDTMKANAEAAEDVGYDVIVERIYDGRGLHGGKDECLFCKNREFKGSRSEAEAKDVFRRHPGCKCAIAYTVDGRTQVQTDWRKNQWTDAQDSDRMIMQRFSANTDIKRNQKPLTDKQFEEAENAARRQGYRGTFVRSNDGSTSFHPGFPPDDPFIRIGPDAFPNKDGTRANELVSVDGAMAHEVVGHLEAYLKGTSQADADLEEVQASIRASKFGQGLSEEDRQLLMQDAMDRLERKGLTFDDVKNTLDIWER